MPASTILSAGVIILIFLVSIASFHAWHTRRHPQAPPPATLPARIKRFLVVGTDTDLKLELIYLVYLFGVALLAPKLRRPPSDNWLLLLLAFLLGFHLRQWLSKWRLRNLVFFPILLERRLLYFKGATDTSIIVVNIILGAYLASANLWFAAAQFVGFIAHEVSLETKKGRRLLTRKLYLFDLEGLAVPPETYQNLLAAVRRYDFRTLDKITNDAAKPKDHLVLSAFSALLRDDFPRFYDLLRANRTQIESDVDLLYYFGKALYILGDLDNARPFLKRGCDEHRSRLCVSYYALSLLAEATERREVEPILSLFETHASDEPTSRGDMFLSAFHALALAISTNRYPEDARQRLSKALSLVHHAFTINDEILRKGQLGLLGRLYYRANDQIFLDIYGYVLLRMGNLSLSFRALHAAIADDDTYPWPYFHLALLYQRLGRAELAEPLLLRIARHERSNTVLKRLCIARLEHKKNRKSDSIDAAPGPSLQQTPPG